MPKSEPYPAKFTFKIMGEISSSANSKGSIPRKDLLILALALERSVWGGHEVHSQLQAEAYAECYLALLKCFKVNENSENSVGSSEETMKRRKDDMSPDILPLLRPLAPGSDGYVWPSDEQATHTARELHLRLHPNSAESIEIDLGRYLQRLRRVKHDTSQLERELDSIYGGKGCYALPFVTLTLLPDDVENLMKSRLLRDLRDDWMATLFDHLESAWAQNYSAVIAFKVLLGCIAFLQPASDLKDPNPGPNTWVGKLKRLCEGFAAKKQLPPDIQSWLSVLCAPGGLDKFLAQFMDTREGNLVKKGCKKDYLNLCTDLVGQLKTWPIENWNLIRDDRKLPTAGKGKTVSTLMCVLDSVVEMRHRFTVVSQPLSASVGSQSDAVVWETQTSKQSERKVTDLRGLARIGSSFDLTSQSEYHVPTLYTSGLSKTEPRVGKWELTQEGRMRVMYDLLEGGERVPDGTRFTTREERTRRAKLATFEQRQDDPEIDHPEFTSGDITVGNIPIERARLIIWLPLWFPLEPIAHPDLASPQNRADGSHPIERYMLVTRHRFEERSHSYELAASEAQQALDRAAKSLIRTDDCYRLEMVLEKGSDEASLPRGVYRIAWKTPTHEAFMAAYAQRRRDVF